MTVNVSIPKETTGTRGFYTDQCGVRETTNFQVFGWIGLASKLMAVYVCVYNYVPPFGEGA